MAKDFEDTRDTMKFAPHPLDALRPDDEEEDFEMPVIQKVKIRRRSMAYVEQFVPQENMWEVSHRKMENKRLLHILLGVALVVLFYGMMSDFVREQFKTTSRYEGDLGTYFVNQETRTILCPDRTECTFGGNGAPYWILYPNGFKLEVYPVGKIGGVSSYSSSQSELLTTEVVQSQKDVKNALLSHLGHSPNVSVWSFLGVLGIFLSVYFVFKPYQFGYIKRTLFIQTKADTESVEYAQRVQLIAAVCLVLCIMLASTGN